MTADEIAPGQRRVVNDNETPEEVVAELRGRAERYRALAQRLRTYGASIGEGERPREEG